MITASYIQQNGYIELQLNFPKGPQYVEVHGGLGEAERLVYYHNRKYIIEKLTSWLNQRKVAVKQSFVKSKVLTVAKMQVMVSSHRDKSLYQVCKMVSLHMPLISEIAPDPASDHYAYFHKTIEPILKYCTDKD